MKNNRHACLICPAKVNFSLEVLGKREDGYHEICSVVLPISLSDFIYYGKSDSFSLEVEGPFAHHCQGDNLIEKAWNLFAEEWEVPPFSFLLEKNIPAGGGLGGGSSDVGRLLRMMSEKAAKPPGMRGLQKAALVLGADVPFFLSLRPAIMRGIGEFLTPFHLQNQLPLTVVFPGVGQATPQAYARLNAPPVEAGQIEKAEDRAHRLIHFLDMDKAPIELMRNDFQRIQKKPEGLEGDWFLSGSGSCWFHLGHVDSPYPDTFKVTTV